MGDVFLVYSRTRLRFVHTGIIVRVHSAFATAGDRKIFSCGTVEGNSNNDGSANGTTTLQRTRKFNTFVGDRFVRWPNLDQRLMAA